MKKKLYGNDDVISVYKFMEMCGLHCEIKGNIHISHEIMMRKLALRNRKFPNEVLMPSTVSFKTITKERVKRGGVVLVKDDMDKIIGYKYPRFMNTDIHEYTALEREEIRNNLINEELNKNDNTDLPRGYQKYLYRKNLKELEEEKEKIINALMADAVEHNEITEKVGRERVLQKRKRQYY